MAETRMLEIDPNSLKGENPTDTPGGLGLPTYRDMGFDQYFRYQWPKSQNLSAVGYDSQQEGFNVLEYSIADGAVTKKKIKSINAELIETSTLTAKVDVGSKTSGFVRMDGPNNRILINDGTTNRILIGNV